MLKLDASESGSFRIGGEIEVHRLGFGAMRLTGPGIWGPPVDRAEAILGEFPTSGSISSTPRIPMGPMSPSSSSARHFIPMTVFLSLLRRVCGDPVRVNGNAMVAPNICVNKQSKAAKGSGLEQIGLWQLHSIDPKVPRDEQFAVIKSLQEDGIIRHAGLSNVTVDDIKAASKMFKVATVQNRYNLVDRGSEDVLNYCEENGIGFIPWFPLAAGRLVKAGSILDTVANAHNATPGQIALAWVLKRSPVMLPIPGTSKVTHLEENVAAVNIELSDEEFDSLDREGRTEYRQA
jgi:pyridoxine 4-dehydrogenase